MGRWGLDQWLAAAGLAAAAWGALWRLAPLAAGSWQAWSRVLWPAALAIAILIMRRWANRHDYVLFAPEETPPPAGHPLAPAEKLILRATGEFTVEGRRQFFAGLLAYWRTF